MNGRRNNERGFTLLELLMVVVIMAILASIALPQYFRVVERSRAAQVMPLLASLRGSEIRFKAQDVSELYTTTLTALDIEPVPVMPAGWDAVTVSGTAAGSNVSTNRNTGSNKGSLLIVDIDTGTVCASLAAAAADWNVVSSALCP